MIQKELNSLISIMKAPHNTSINTWYLIKTLPIKELREKVIIEN